jgi:hypothetical protein
LNSHIDDGLGFIKRKAWSFCGALSNGTSFSQKQVENDILKAVLISSFFGCGKRKSQNNK